MTTYRKAGVDIAGAELHVGRIEGSVTSTWGEDVVGRFGGFAAGVRVPAGYRSPVLMMTTDGVGTKLEIARLAGLWDGVGQDLVAMCVDDLAAVGARPIGLVDYMAVGSLQPERDEQIVASIADACRRAGCPLLGGETAVHPGVMGHDAVDLAAAAMGVVEADGQIGPDLVRAGDLVVGLASPNLRSNGYSLVRSALGEAVVENAAALLEPSVIYAPVVLEVIEGGGVHAAAHITGGGLTANLERSMPPGLVAVVDRSAWEPPAIYDLLAGIEEDEMFATFNMGIGFCLMVDPDRVDQVLTTAAEHEPVVIGEVDDRATLGLG
jgi:phosphoribosylformylglycinamidine cyclo-ligase